jgi:DMSO/TMAO reductase YedYZ molybdopterin-dependent catalytic subunit
MNDDNQIRIDKVRELLREKGGSIWPDGDDNTANVIGEQRYLSEPLSDAEAKRRMSAMSRRGFLVGGVAALTGIFGWRWRSDETKAALFRRTLEFNEKVSQIFYRPSRLAPEFPLTSISADRSNGAEGLEGEVDPATWTLAVGGLAGRTSDLILTLDEIKKLPRTEMTTEFKCIEGWSTIIHWAGVRFSDFTAKYLPQTHNGTQPDVANHPQDLLPYVSITTPDEKYYVGWDMPSILHPQTLLAYEMNGAPLTLEHGAPLRLASPTKYGIKQIKRIGRIEFTNERPRDFWAEYDYDWYAGH